MKPTTRVFLVLGALLALGGAFVLLREIKPRPASRDAAASSAPAPSAPPAIGETGSSATPASASEPPAASPRVDTHPLLAGDAAREAITDLAVTYDAVSVPALARYLGHSDPEIRAAARDGLIQLGERAAIPFLEAAAKTAPADEAKELREAAEFLALPTWTEHRAAQKKAKAAGESSAR